MVTIQIVPKQVVVLTEFTLEELTLLRRGLEATELSLNTKNSSDVDVSDFMTKKLYPYVKDLLVELGVDDA